ncbi:GntR family transcriptional regulator [Parasporobacterium paucivorans]|uniref:DNA-binding transcriptional regulator, GntR family n=1 Tax=Parasporobacterium paucivorans DSM 15970 TaxID=1122934 RepID=A0A1M6FC40_9FIRM|nr:GntR family transcriptional regulator [Parasporobacterium paucivorans]SHI95232.1 DNA-binding transcriptional regulator, GntR family [Parasporobacterium paucivorans DSM 15970]
MVKIKKMSLVDQVYESLRDRIIKMDIPLGSRLTLIKLQEEYSVSSTPVREALNRLMNEGLVDFENNVGATVIEITADDVREIQELAAAYEMAACYYAMEKGNHDEMANEISRYVDDYRDSKDLKESCICIRRIKNVFYTNADNKRIINRSNSLKGQEEILHNLFVMPDSATSSCFSEFPAGIVFFETIRDAVREGDVLKILDALKEHRVWSRGYIIKNLKNSVKAD